MLASLREHAEKNGAPLLVLAGPYEFIPTEAAAPEAPADAAKALAAAFVRLPYDLGYALPAESRWLADHGAALPPYFRVAGERPVSEVRQVGGVRVGLLLFPALAPSLVKAPQAIAKAVADSALNLRERSDIVVGVSPWGASAETDFLETRGHTVDVLLGSGPGPGFPARPMAGDKVLWVRSYSQGKALVQVVIKTLPSRTPEWRWVREQNAVVLLQSLNESITNDPGMDALLAGYRLEQPAN
ncbi:MAG: hypothetical protein AB1916_06525 [Thermodesulfobacteriota bacterium]